MLRSFSRFFFFHVIYIIHVQWIIIDCLRNHVTMSRCIKVTLWRVWHLRLFRVKHETINNDAVTMYSYNILTEFTISITLNLKSFQFLPNAAWKLIIYLYLTCLEPYLVPLLLMLFAIPCVPFRVYASTSWLDQLLRTVPSFLSRNICIETSCKLSSTARRTIENPVA